jgi:Protein of unknown function (DUF1488)
VDMPLARLNDVYEAELEGIGFGMLAGKRAIRCVVTDDALTGAIGGNPTLAQKLAWFGHNRSRVE